MSITATRSVRKSLKPEMQGHIDGMCSVYAVLNACKLMFGHEERLDKRLFKFLCDANSELFPKLVYDGTEVAGLSSLLDASVKWVARTHRRDMTWSQPLRRRPMATVKEYFSYVDTELRDSRHARAVAIIGLAKPWGHWDRFTSCIT
jgi:hypothetical protein